MMRNYPELTQEEQERQKNDAAILLDNSRVYITVWERWESEYKVIKRTELPNNVLRWLQDERKAYGGAYTYAVRWGTDPLTPVVVWEQIYHYCDAELNRLLADPPPVDTAPPAPPPGNNEGNLFPFGYFNDERQFIWTEKLNTLAWVIHELRNLPVSNDDKMIEIEKRIIYKGKRTTITKYLEELSRNKSRPVDFSKSQYHEAAVELFRTFWN